MWKEYITVKFQRKRSCKETNNQKDLKFLGHIMRKEDLKNLTLTGHTEGKRDKGKQQVSCLTSFSKGMAEQEQRGVIKC